MCQPAEVGSGPAGYKMPEGSNGKPGEPGPPGLPGLPGIGADGKQVRWEGLAEGCWMYIDMNKQLFGSDLASLRFPKAL